MNYNKVEFCVTMDVKTYELSFTNVSFIGNLDTSIGNINMLFTYHLADGCHGFKCQMKRQYIYSELMAGKKLKFSILLEETGKKDFKAIDFELVETWIVTVDKGI